MDEAGGKGLALMVDIRDEEAVARSIDETVKHFGGIDILVNNASAIALTGTEVRKKNYNLKSTGWGISLLQWYFLKLFQ